MPVDGVLLHKIVRELKRLEGQHLHQIYQPTSSDYYLLFEESVRVCLRPDFPHVSIAKKERASEKMPSSFTMFLRKELKGAKLLEVFQVGIDRTVGFVFEKFDEIEGLVRKTLYVEIMGVHSNMVLTKDGRILDAHKRIVTRKREILPGKEYVLFPSGKVSLFELVELPERRNGSAKEVLMGLLEGFSSVSVEELLRRSGHDPDVGWDEVDREKLLLTLAEVKEEISKDEVYVYYEGSHPVEVSAFRFVSFPNPRLFRSASEGLNEFVRWKEEKSTFDNLKRSLRKVVEDELERVEDLEEKLTVELQETRKMDHYKKLADLIVQNLWTLENSSGKVTLVDWETGEEVEVDVGKDPSQKAQEYYEIYKKLKRKREVVKERLEELERERYYLSQLLQSIEDAEDVETLKEIEEEMRETGLMKEKTKEKVEKVKGGFREVTYKGFKILIGKNNKQNDELVRTSSKEDLWLHAHEIPGAHVVVRTGGREVPEDVLEFAASLAAGYSKGKDSGKVPVDYTLIKHVRKPRNAKPGMVLYTDYKTIVVRPRRLEG